MLWHLPDTWNMNGARSRYLQITSKTYAKSLVNFCHFSVMIDIHTQL
jgi:hypothetical protein